MEFRAKSANHSITYRPSTTEIGPFGTKVKERGESLNFENFRYRTDDPAKIRFLKSLPDYGIRFASIDEADMIPAPKQVQMVAGSRGADLEDQTSDVTLIKSSTRKEKV